MAGIRLEWAQFGDFDSFDVIRSDAPMDINALPSPIATNLPTMYYVDTTVVEGASYYYRVVAWRDAVSKVSGEIEVIADRNVHWDKVTALLRFNGDLIDASGKGTYTKSSSIAFVAEGKFNKCLYFSPSVNSDAVVTNDYSLWDFKGDDFTIEFFIKFETLTSGEILHGYGANSNSSFVMGMDNSIIYFDFRRVGNSYTSGVRFAVPPINTWAHIAIVRNGDYFSAFVDGDRIAYQYVPYAMQSLNLPVRIGGYSSGSAFNGYIDEMRVTKGIARYTENFMPPTEPFPSS